MKNPNEIVVLRTKLRNVNVEYSALVRARRSDGRPARLHALHMQRHALMARILDASQGAGPRDLEAFVHNGSSRLVSRSDRLRGDAAAPR